MSLNFGELNLFKSDKDPIKKIENKQIISK